MENKRLNRDAEGISSIIDDLIREIEELESDIEGLNSKLEEKQEIINELIH